MSRPRALALLLSLIVTLQAAPGLGATCRDLARELTLVSRSGASNEAAPQIQAEIERFRSLVSGYRQSLRSAGCGFNLFRRRDEAVCQTVRPKLNDAEYRLSSLKRQLRQAESTMRSRAATIRRDMSRLGCDRHFAAARRDIGRRIIEDRPQEKANPAREPVRAAASGPKFRTLCVRSCDGYLFPVSFETEEQNFARDENICRMQCPAGNPKLFVHRTYSEWTEDARALDGTRLKDHPNAFSYRKKLDPACSCHRTKTRSGLMVVAGGSLHATTRGAELHSRSVTGSVQIISGESRRQGYGTGQDQDLAPPSGALTAEADPDTAYRLRSGTSLDLLLSLIPPSGKSVSQGVRVIGPQRYPVRSTEAKAQDPVPTIVR